MNLNFHNDDIIEASRSKVSNEKKINNRLVTIPPVMFVKVSDKLRKQILGNSWRLANLKDDLDGYGYYVKQSMPEEYRAHRVKYQPEYDRIKDENFDVPEGEPRSDCWYVEDRFYVDGKEQKEEITPPTPADIIFMSAETRRKVDALVLQSSLPKEQSRSKFTAFCAHIFSREEVRIVYMKVKKLEQNADHIMVAYRIKDGDVVINGSVSNGENFGDLKVMKELVFQDKVNVVVLVARRYGGIHLGNARFDIIKAVTEEALAKVPADIFCVPKPQRSENRRGRGRGRGRGGGRGFSASGRGRGGYGSGRGGFRGRYQHY